MAVGGRVLVGQVQIRGGQSTSSEEHVLARESDVNRFLLQWIQRRLLIGAWLRKLYWAIGLDLAICNAAPLLLAFGVTSQPTHTATKL